MRGKIPTAPAILVVSFLVLVAGICANSTTRMPAAIVDAVGTATAIAPAVEPTRMWNRDHLPALQKEHAIAESAAITETGTWDLLVIKATGMLNLAWRVVGLGLAVSALIAALGLGAMAGVGVVVVMVALACYAWERYKMAQAFTPYQVMPYAPALLPGLKMLIDPSTGRQTDITQERPADAEHGQLLIGREIVSVQPTPEQSKVFEGIKRELYAGIFRSIVPSAAGQWRVNEVQEVVEV